MVCTSFSMKHAWVVFLLLVPSISQAALTVYTDRASFLAAVESPGVDTFTGFSTTSPTQSPIFRTAGPYAYTASTDTSSFFGAGTLADTWLATNIAATTITFNEIPSNVYAAGGFFFGSSASGAFASGSVTVNASDAAGSTSTQTFAGSTNGFLGFVSDTSVTSLSVLAVQPSGGFLWPTVNDLTLAAVNTDRIFANGFQ